MLYSPVVVNRVIERDVGEMVQQPEKLESKGGKN